MAAFQSTHFTFPPSARHGGRGGGAAGRTGADRRPDSPRRAGGGLEPAVRGRHCRAGRGADGRRRRKCRRSRRLLRRLFPGLRAVAAANGRRVVRGEGSGLWIFFPFRMQFSLSFFFPLQRMKWPPWLFSLVVAVCVTTLTLAYLSATAGYVQSAGMRQPAAAPAPARPLPPVVADVHAAVVRAAPLPQLPAAAPAPAPLRNASGPAVLTLASALREVPELALSGGRFRFVRCRPPVACLHEKLLGAG